MSDLEPERIIRLEGDRVVLLDQRRLPDEEVELECRSAAEVAQAIRGMAVRGAPAIGVAAAYGYALAARRGEDLEEAERILRDSRPTAVNLAWALDRMRDDATAESARQIHGEEVERCRRMAEAAAPLLGPGARALTHCNTGALATGGYGTALGALRRAWEKGLLAHVWVDETRPLLQGARLTAWELERLGIPFAVVADAAAGSLMAAGDVDCVLTGADRIAANGDTANKIGTYALAVLAAHHRIPFYVVAPTSSIDPAAPSGAAIPIEERAAEELTSRFPARNPAFDVTPASLIAAIVTEEGVHRPPYAESLAGAVAASSASWGAADKGDKRAARRTVQRGTAERRERSTSLVTTSSNCPGEGSALSPGKLPSAASGGGRDSAFETGGRGLALSPPVWPAGADAGQGGEE